MFSATANSKLQPNYYSCHAVSKFQSLILKKKEFQSLNKDLEGEQAPWNVNLARVPKKTPVGHIGHNTRYPKTEPV